jgi:hypothetical protein
LSTEPGDRDAVDKLARSENLIDRLRSHPPLDIKFFLKGQHDLDLFAHMNKAFGLQTITETVLKVHLLVERAIAAKIESKLVRPDILNQGQWSFSQKLSLYIGLFDPPEDQIKLLRGLNRLRNAIAHKLTDEAALVAEHLAWLGDGERPEPILHIRAVSCLLLFGLDALKSVEVGSGPFDDGNII